MIEIREFRERVCVKVKAGMKRGPSYSALERERERDGLVLTVL